MLHPDQPISFRKQFHFLFAEKVDDETTDLIHILTTADPSAVVGISRVPHGVYI